LGDHNAARIVCRQCGRVDIDIGRFLIETDITVRVAEGTADDRDIARKGKARAAVAASA
jgi:hypothetical protein